jgi:hypothetical protein
MRGRGPLGFCIVTSAETPALLSRAGRFRKCIQDVLERYGLDEMAPESCSQCAVPVALFTVAGHGDKRR